MIEYKNSPELENYIEMVKYYTKVTPIDNVWSKGKEKIRDSYSQLKNENDKLRALGFLKYMVSKLYPDYKNIKTTDLSLLYFDGYVNEKTNYSPNVLILKEEEPDIQKHLNDLEDVSKKRKAEKLAKEQEKERKLKEWENKSNIEKIKILVASYDPTYEYNDYAYTDGTAERQSKIISEISKILQNSDGEEKKQLIEIIHKKYPQDHRFDQL